MGTARRRSASAGAAGAPSLPAGPVVGPVVRLVGLLCALLLAACGGDVPPPEADQSPSGASTPSPRTASSTPLSPSRPPATRAPDRPALDTWQVGSRVLPRRPDGFGVVRPTPPELRVRRLPSTGALPGPADGRFASSVRPMTPALARRLSLAWSPGCPVPLRDLRLARVTFRGFDGEAHTGELVLRQDVVSDVVGVFRTLYAADFPIEQMRVVQHADLDAPPTGDGNNTGTYACRPTRGSTSWSSHARGLAIDVNPFMNPYTRQDSDLVLPELASAYLDRGRRRPGMVLPDGVVVRAFARIGWTWGATFSTVSDPMHFSADGR